MRDRCRALSTPFLCEFNSPGGLYTPLVELVAGNKDLHLELRGQLANPAKPEDAPPDEAVGIFYKGNCLVSLHSNQRVDIDKAFTRDLKIPKYLREPKDVQEYLNLVPHLMYRISSSQKRSMEIEYEQMLIRANNLEERNNSEYIVLASQYNIGKDRLDLLAVKWPRNKRGGGNPIGQLALIEVKYALNNDIQNADQQLARYYDHIRASLNELCSEMELILSQKLSMGLIRRTPEQLAALRRLILSRDVHRVEMVLFLVDYNPNSIWKDKMVRKAMQLPFHDQIRIVSGGLAMWDKTSAPLTEVAKGLLVLDGN